MENSTAVPEAPDSPHSRASAFDYLAAAPWAMLPGHLKLMADIARREHGGIEAVEAQLGRKLQNTRAVTLRDGIASIPVTGPVFRYANLFTDVSGAVSLDTLARDFAAAEADPAVREIVLVMDTPGGQAAGIAEFAAQVRAASKPVTAYVDGMAASAGYWIAAAARRIVVSKTGEVGSIGAVVQMSTDRRPGVVEIVSAQSPNKRPDIATDQGRALIQQRINALAQVFVDDVAAYRGVPVDTVLQRFGQGDMRMGAEAVALGMADAVGTYESLIASLAAGKPSPAGRASTTGAKHMADQTPALPETSTATAPLTCESLTAAHPDIAQALREQGAATERARIQSVRAQAIPGHETLIESLAFDGKSTAADAALAIIAAEKSGGQKRLDAMRAAAPAPLPFAAAPTPETPAASDDHLPLEDRCAAKWKAEPALREEFGTVERYVAFERASAKGVARIHTRT